MIYIKKIVLVNLLESDETCYIIILASPHDLYKKIVLVNLLESDATCYIIILASLIRNLNGPYTCMFNF